MSKYRYNSSYGVETPTVFDKRSLKVYLKSIDSDSRNLRVWHISVWYGQIILFFASVKSRYFFQ